METLEKKIQQANALMPKIKTLETNMAILRIEGHLESLVLRIGGFSVNTNFSKERLEELKKELIENAEKERESLIQEVENILKSEK